MAFVFSHESACVIPHFGFFVFLVWHDEVTLYLLSDLSLGPQALCVQFSSVYSIPSNPLQAQQTYWI